MEKPSALWRRLTTFRRKEHIGVNIAFIPALKRSKSRAMFFRRGDVSEKSFGGRPRRIAHFAKLGPRMGNCVSPALKLPH